MNRCLSFAWLGHVGIGGITHKGRREKNPRSAEPGKNCIRSTLLHDVVRCGVALVGFEKTMRDIAMYLDKAVDGGGMIPRQTTLKLSLRGKPVRWDKL